MNTAKMQHSICSLLVITGISFWVLALYDYIVSGFDIHAIHWLSTMLFGIMIPAPALIRLRQLNKTADTRSMASFDESAA